MSTIPLHPIVIQPITHSSGYFTCAGEGLRHEDQARETPETLRDLLLPRGGRQPIGDREHLKVWWRAQCLFYDLPAPKSSTIAQLRTALENSLRSKTMSLKQGLLDDEHSLNVEFRELNARVRDRTSGGQAKGKSKDVKKTEGSPTKASNSKGQVNEVKTPGRVRQATTTTSTPAKPVVKTSTKTKSAAMGSKAPATDPPEEFRYDSDSDESEPGTGLMAMFDDVGAAKPRNKTRTTNKAMVTSNAGKKTGAKQAAFGSGSGQTPLNELQPEVMHVGGVWQIHCQDMESQCDFIQGPFEFVVQQSASNGSFLASFDFGILTGLFRPLRQSYGSIVSPSLSSSKPPIVSSYIRFEWCGENDEGEIQLPTPFRSGWIRFESDKTGSQQWGEKKVAKTLKGGIDTGFAGTCKFEGIRMDYENDHNLSESWDDYNVDA